MQPHTCYRGQRVSDASYRGQFWRAVVALEQISRCDFTFHRGHRSKGRPFSRRISSRIDVSIRDALQELINADAALPAFNVRRFEIQIINLRYAAGAMHHQVGWKCLWGAVDGPMYDEFAGALLDLLYRGFEVQGDTEFCCRVCQPIDHIRIKALERALTTM